MWNALFVVIGAVLWATDAIFRHPLSQQISALTIVYYEHIFATAIALVWLLISDRKRIFLSWKETCGAAFIGIFGSAIATVLFTMSFQLVNPSVTILLQKTQPMIAIVLAALFLGEKISANFLVWAGIAILSAFLISFPTGIHVQDFYGQESLGYLFALLAAVLWATCTVVGKSILKHAPSSALSFWRFAFGLLGTWALARRSDQAMIEIPFVPTQPAVLHSLMYIAILPGFLGVSLYYKGLSKIKASRATILELVFPITAVAINAYFLGYPLLPIQMAAAATLMISMVAISSLQ